MRFSNTDSQSTAITERILLSLAAGLMIGVVLGQYVTPSTGHRLLIGFFLSAIAFRTQSVAATTLIPLAAVAISSALLRVAGVIFSYQFNFVWLGILFVFCGLLLVLRWQTIAETKLQVVDVLAVTLLAACLQFLTRQSTWELEKRFLRFR